METSVIKLEDWTDQATKVMLNNVIERKKKFDKLKRKHFQTSVSSFILGLLFMVYLYQFILKPYSYSFFDMYSVFVDDFMNLIYMLIVFGLYGYMLFLKKKLDKAETEYHALRCEIIDRSKDLWKHEDSWKKRHKVYEMMKKNYDINLYHENK
ncbi:YpbF family protein [Peribacillus alkalitolerans]|uniref:YpbF family protein n=1 Tax=Peribacillus alkalitolerans TaxID=1550385 RepID=UPI0013D4D703|nr:YpbF family protein [Peribacillus alkalitolerans]